MKTQTARRIQARNNKPKVHSVVRDHNGEIQVVKETSWSEARIMKMIGTIDKISEIEIGQIKFFGGGSIELYLNDYLQVVDTSEEALEEIKASEEAALTQKMQGFIQMVKRIEKATR